MPDPSYPGVYFEESPGGLHAITGVATSITAFLGRAARGPIVQPTVIHSFFEYQGIYGDLSPGSPMGYAVRDFFTNGGRQAVIQRMYRAPEGEPSPAATLAPGGLRLVAASPGLWGRNLSARVERSGSTLEKAGSSSLDEADLFNLEVIEAGGDGIPVTREWFPELSTRLDAGERRVDLVLGQESRLVRLALKEDGAPDLPAGNPAAAAEFALQASASGGADSAGLLDEDYEAGLARLDQADLINLLCLPPDQQAAWPSKSVYQMALAFCVRRRAMLIVDPSPDWGKNLDDFLAQAEEKVQAAFGFAGIEARNAVLYFPRVLQPDPMGENRLQAFPPCGLIAGVIARTDEKRGVWKAPAGAEAVLIGAEGLELDLSNRENEILNPLGINCLRSFPTRGSLIWGARTLRGADHYADDYKYVPVRRLALFIEESLDRGIQWAFFEPNSEPLWAQIRLHASGFMHGLFLQGAFSGSTPAQAYFVKCGADTTTQDDIDAGFFNILVGFATLKPAEFLILQFRQQAGQAAS
jgi:hypothetical protein